MKKEKIISLLFVILICGGIGYGVYRNSGKVIHKVLLLEGETIRVGNLSQRKVSHQYKKHELAVSGPQAYSVYLEGRFPDSTKRVSAENEYELKIVASGGTVLFDDNVRILFKRKDQKEGLNRLIADFFPGTTSKKVTDLSDLTSETDLTIHFSRIGGDTVANELYLTIREKRG